MAGCAAGRRFSHIVARHDDSGRQLADYVGRRAAVNAVMSNSGYDLFRAAVVPLAQPLADVRRTLNRGQNR